MIVKLLKFVFWIIYVKYADNKHHYPSACHGMHRVRTGKEYVDGIVADLQDRMDCFW